MATVCQFCERDARFLGAQSIDLGKTITWVPICEGHADGWNEGGDWDAPIRCLPPAMVADQPEHRRQQLREDSEKAAKAVKQAGAKLHPRIAAVKAKK